jgi:Helix-turn-helix domain
MRRERRTPSAEGSGTPATGPLLKPAEAAQRLRCSVSTVWNLVWRNEIAASYVAGRCFIGERALEEYLSPKVARGAVSVDLRRAAIQRRWRPRAPHVGKPIQPENFMEYAKTLYKK